MTGTQTHRHDTAADPGGVVVEVVVVVFERDHGGTMSLSTTSWPIDKGPSSETQ